MNDVGPKVPMTARDLHVALWKMGYSVHYRDLWALPDYSATGMAIRGSTYRDEHRILIATEDAQLTDLILRHEFCHANGIDVVLQTPDELAHDLRCGNLPPIGFR